MSADRAAKMGRTGAGSIEGSDKVAGAMAALRRGLLAAAAFGLSACTSGPAPASVGEVLCSGAGLRVDADFAAGGRHDCVVTPEGGLVVSVDHEPVVVEGVNPSPWFAFRIVSDDARDATVTLDYTDYKHRYRPYVSRDGTDWTAIDPTKLTLNEKQTRASLALSLPDGVLFVAGQPLSASDDNLRWTAEALGGLGFARTEYGRSLEGRALVGFAGGGEATTDAVVIVTRQHPPETSGQDAYRGFIERLVARNDAQALAFRTKHRIIIAPMPNPDGVDNGNWRANQGGVDLNRDWRDLSQPETQALTRWILGETDGRRTVAMMDFHSTDRTVIYAPPLDAPSPTVGWLNTLKATLDAQLGLELPWTYSHSETGGTSKTWALEKLKAPGITVELWDQSPVEDSRKVGAATADALIDYFTR